jgi:hypothetical protein
MTVKRAEHKRSAWGWLGLVGLGVAGAAVIVAWVVVPDQLAQRRQAAAEATQEARLIEACHAAVSFKARYRSRARFTETGYLPGGDGARVVGMVDMLNGLGTMLPFQYLCVFDAAGTLAQPVYLAEEGSL